MTTWDALAKRLDRVKKPIRTFSLCDDPDIRDRYLAAKREADRADTYLQSLSPDADTQARALVEKQAKDAHTALAEAKKDYDAHTVTLRFQALEQQQLETLLAEHPPTEQDEADGAEFDSGTFMPALIAAASLDGMPVEAAARYLKTWTPVDARALWNAAWSVQHTQRTDLGKG